LADRYGLEQWAKRNVILGLAARHDLYAQAASCTPDDKTELNRIVEQAEQAAKASAGANLGTALHRFTERIDRGEEVMVPAQWQPDVNAYVDTLAANDVDVIAGTNEQIVVIPQLGVAGTIDKMVRVPGYPLPMIADLKTGQDVVKYGMGEIAIQLALYAGATHMWDGSAYHQMPAVDREHALVIHLPVGQGRCELHVADIAAGREAVRKAMWVREWRKKSKELSSPLARGSMH
jgi:hypothetical protein